MYKTDVAATSRFGRSVMLPFSKGINALTWWYGHLIMLPFCKGINVAAITWSLDNVAIRY